MAAARRLMVQRHWRRALAVLLIAAMAGGAKPSRGETVGELVKTIGGSCREDLPVATIQIDERQVCKSCDDDNSADEAPLDKIRRFQCYHDAQHCYLLIEWQKMVVERYNEYVRGCRVELIRQGKTHFPLQTRAIMPSSPSMLPISDDALIPMLEAARKRAGEPAAHTEHPSLDEPDSWTEEQRR